MMRPPGAPFPRGRIAVLGIVTIAAYGAWFYAFGVLLDPIIEDTGWSEAALAAAYSAGLLMSGLGALVGGWLLDRFGSSLVFAGSAVISGTMFLLAATATSLLTFSVLVALGGGALGALSFYHITQTVAVRIAGPEGNRAIALLTIWGAFASVLAIPAAAWIEARAGWRASVVVLAGTAAIALMAAAATVQTPGEASASMRRVFGALRRAAAGPVVRRFLASQALAGIAVSVILVYQVPAMTSAGLPLATASAVAGFRGFAQLGGRLPLTAIVRRVGVTRSMRLAYATIVAGSLVLAVAGRLGPALVFAVLAGFGIGAMSALVGMYAAEVFPAAGLGTAMGLSSLVFGVVGAAGPAAAGVLAEATGSRAWPAVAAAVVAATAGAVLRNPLRPPEHSGSLGPSMLPPI